MFCTQHNRSHISSWYFLNKHIQNCLTVLCNINTLSWSAACPRCQRLVVSLFELSNNCELNRVIKLTTAQASGGRVR